ncbi:hypothetical protein FQR65_LT20063 [Abscondita terminalis]|nr:hypothetical protein FQR65_LT20063 [Abscondita terminalis]
MGTWARWEQGSKDRYFRHSSGRRQAGCPKASKSRAGMASRSAASSHAAGAAACAQRNGLCSAAATIADMRSRPSFVRSAAPTTRESRPRRPDHARQPPNYPGRLTVDVVVAVALPLLSAPRSPARAQPAVEQAWQRIAFKGSVRRNLRDAAAGRQARGRSGQGRQYGPAGSPNRCVSPAGAGRQAPCRQDPDPGFAVRAVHTQLNRPAAIREIGVYWNPGPGTTIRRRSPASVPRASSVRGGPESTTLPGAARPRRRKSSTAACAIFGHLLRQCRPWPHARWVWSVTAGEPAPGVWMSHGDPRVGPRPVRLKPSRAMTARIPVRTWRNEDTGAGTACQFPPGSDRTACRARRCCAASSWVDVCGCQPLVEPPARRSSTTRSVRVAANRVGDDEVILGLSGGGVDSSVVAALLHKAIGEKLDLCLRDSWPAAAGGRRTR